MKKRIILFLLAVLVFTSITACSSQKSYFAEAPYGIELGCSYDELKRLDKGAPELSLGKNGDSQYSNHTGLDGTFLGCDADALSVDILYIFDTDEKLNKIYELITVKDSASMTPTQLYRDLCSGFTKSLGEPDSSIPETFALWNTDGSDISIIPLDNSISIVFELT